MVSGGCNRSPWGIGTRGSAIPGPIALYNKFKVIQLNETVFKKKKPYIEITATKKKMYNEKTGQVLRTESQDGENNGGHAEA